MSTDASPRLFEPFQEELISPSARTGKVELNELESHLWGAANILRGPIDQADFKSYVFPLLFLKRISDVYDEEYQEALDESDGDVDYASFAENHRFQVPDGAHWDDLRERTENVGQAIQQAMRSIEQANPNKLYGIFGDTQWTNKERLPDALLRDLIDHFSKLPLSNGRVAPDVLGNAYEYLIKKFADLTNKKAGEFYTPRSVVKMLVNFLDPQEGETVYDPACGTGGMLIEVVQHVREGGGRVQLLWGKVFGQEKNLTTAAIARMNLFLHGVEDFEVVRGDTLRDPAFFVGDELATFDCVIANPPFSLEKWGEEVWASDRFGRNFAGMPPKKSGDFAWVQHMVKSMAAKTGRLAVVLPQGALFRGGAEQRIRKHLLEATSSRPSSALRRTSSTARASPPACWSCASARRPSARARSSSSTPPRCSSVGATRTRSNTSTASASCSSTPPSLTRRAWPRSPTSTRLPATTSTSTSAATSRPSTTRSANAGRGDVAASRPRSTRPTRPRTGCWSCCAPRGWSAMSEVGAA